MNQDKKVSAEVIKRLPRYYRYLGDLKKNGVVRISSKALAQSMNVTASQIRQDFNCFGMFGQQGYGYNVEVLQSVIGEILGINSGHKTIIIGAGYLGHALANYKPFEKRGFRLIGIFDIDKEVIGQKINDVEIMSMEEIEKFVKSHKPDIAIITVPKAAANEVVDKLIKCKIKGILNFTYTDIAVPDGISIENVHPSDALMTLSYKIKTKKEGKK